MRFFFCVYFNVYQKTIALKGRALGIRKDVCFKACQVKTDLFYHPDVLPFQRFRKKEQKQKVLNEIGILKKISNPQIVKFVEAFKSFNEIIIITEYLNGGELFDR